METSQSRVKGPHGLIQGEGAGMGKQASKQSRKKFCEKLSENKNKKVKFTFKIS